jgi:protein ImuB
MAPKDSPEGARLAAEAGLRRGRDLPTPVRLACVDLPAWPLQLLVRRNPEWRDLPAAVVAEDSPQAPLLWVNAAARQAGVLPGQRYAAALSLAHELRAGTVPARVIARAGQHLHRLLGGYSPRVEAARHEPGVFWLDARGLERLHGSVSTWAERLQRALAAAGWVASVAVGFTRFGSYGLARTRRGVTVIRRKPDELAALRRVPLARLQLPPRLRDDLARLGVHTVGALCDLPGTGVAARFGPEAAELHRLARDAAFAPLQPTPAIEPLLAEEVFEEPEADAWRLIFAVKRRLHPLLDDLASRLRAVRALRLDLVLADRAGTRLREELRPAAPTLDAVLLLELVRLRLERLALEAGVEMLRLRLDDTEATPQTLDLFHRQRQRDPGAAARALARVRAELGDRAVVRAEPTAARLPEARVRWAPVPELTEVPVARVGPGVPTLVRRLLARPRAVATPRPEFLRGGPYRVSGGWWQGEVRRQYAFVAVGEHGLRWAFRDERRGGWREQGRIE